MREPSQYQPTWHAPHKGRIKREPGSVLCHSVLQSYQRNPSSGFNWRKLGKLLKVLKVDAKSVDKVKRFKAKGINDSN